MLEVVLFGISDETALRDIAKDCTLVLIVDALVYNKVLDAELANPMVALRAAVDDVFCKAVVQLYEIGSDVPVSVKDEEALRPDPLEKESDKVAVLFWVVLVQ
jgi:hypothetical protein